MTATVKCPRCQALNPAEPLEVKGHVAFKGESQISFNEATYPVTTSGYQPILVVKCRGCGNNFVAQGGAYSAKTLWPLPVPAAPEEVTEKVAEAYRDARLALAAGSKIGALMAGRTVLIRLLRDKNVPNFQALVEDRTITPALYGGADQLRRWADIVGHEDISADALTEEEVTDVLDYLGTVLEAVYTHQARVNRFAERTKAPKRKSPET